MAEQPQGMLPDKILDLTEALTERVPILHNHQQINSYQDYLAVNYRRIHASSLGNHINFPDPNQDFSNQVRAFVDKGVWKWICGSCGHAFIADKTERFSLCLYCMWPGGDDGWANVVFPPNLDRVERLLLQMPGHRANNFLRDWKPHWSEQTLMDRVAKVAEKVRLGEDLRKLSIAPTRTATTGEILRANHWNNNIKEPIDDLSGDNGPVEFRHGIVPASYTTTERDNLVNESTPTIIWNSTENRLEYYDGNFYRVILRVGQEGISQATAQSLINTAIATHTSEASHGTT